MAAPHTALSCTAPAQFIFPGCFGFVPGKKELLHSSSLTSLTVSSVAASRSLIFRSAVRTLSERLFKTWPFFWMLPGRLSHARALYPVLSRAGITPTLFTWNPAAAAGLPFPASNASVRAPAIACEISSFTPPPAVVASEDDVWGAWRRSLAAKSLAEEVSSTRSPLRPTRRCSPSPSDRLRKDTLLGSRTIENRNSKGAADSFAFPRPASTLRAGREAAAPIGDVEVSSSQSSTHNKPSLAAAVAGNFIFQLLGDTSLLWFIHFEQGTYFT
mmetsp:Transcript_1548/g.3652  ORF Transcript_1548/g.3652 Transcript_1548/m.3652 type:complete len:272 (+) Transcript_1548:1068-1883(+)